MIAGMATGGGQAGGPLAAGDLRIERLERDALPVVRR
jgi:hypothetical protein